MQKAASMANGGADASKTILTTAAAVSPNDAGDTRAHLMSGERPIADPRLTPTGTCRFARQRFSSRRRLSFYNHTLADVGASSTSRLIHFPPASEGAWSDEETTALLEFLKKSRPAASILLLHCSPWKVL